MNSPSEKRLTYIGIGLFFVIMTIVILIAKGTGDDGDSISHFLYARDAFLYPKYFFNHWAKPMYVIIASPFAQLGLGGVKFLNLIALCFSLVLTYRLACRWKIPHAWLAPLFVVAQQRVLTHTLSGLTEPLFALALVYCVWLYDKNKFFWATLLASFLPFFRSEGLIIFCVLIVYLIVKKQWKLIPLLAFGHIFFAFAGYGFHKSLLWVFNTMVYATLDHLWGIGKWSDFITGMPWVTGGFVYFVLVVGLLDGLRRLIFFFQKKGTFATNELWLAYGMFVGYFVAHSIFWTFGIFGSEGLMRVMLCVSPMMGIICARGTNFFTEVNDPDTLWGVQKLLPKAKTVYIQALFVVLAAVFLYRNLNWQIDFNLHPSQLTEYAAAEKYRDKVVKEGYHLYSEALYVDMLFGISPFDSPQYRSFHQILKREPVPEKSLLVWESIFAGGMSKVPFEVIRDDKRFQLIDSFEHHDFIWGGNFKTYIFQTDTVYMRQLKETEPLFFTNFETSTYPNLDVSRARQGTVVLRLDDKDQYSPALEGSISSFFTKPEHRFKVSFDVYIEDINQLPSVVVQTIAMTGQSVNWKNYKINEQIKQPRYWYTVSVLVDAQMTKEPRDVFKIYVWHPNPAPAYIDNLRVDYAD